MSESCGTDTVCEAHVLCSYQIHKCSAPMKLASAFPWHRLNFPQVSVEVFAVHDCPDSATEGWHIFPSTDNSNLLCVFQPNWPLGKHAIF